MADVVQYRLEEMVRGLRDLEATETFSKKELETVVLTRRDFEYRLRSRKVGKENYLSYINYEIALEAERRKRKKSAKLQKNLKKGSTLSDFAGMRHIHKLFESMVKKFPHEIELWYEYIQFCKQTLAIKKIQVVLSQALRYHELNHNLYLLCADHFVKMGKIKSARVILLSALRKLANLQPKLWIEYFRFEAMYLTKLATLRWEPFQKQLAEKDAEKDAEKNAEKDAEKLNEGDMSEPKILKKVALKVLQTILKNMMQSRLTSENKQTALLAIFEMTMGIKKFEVKLINTQETGQKIRGDISFLFEDLDNLVNSLHTHLASILNSQPLLWLHVCLPMFQRPPVNFSIAREILKLKAHNEGATLMSGGMENMDEKDAENGEEETVGEEEKIDSKIFNSVRECVGDIDIVCRNIELFFKAEVCSPCEECSTADGKCVLKLLKSFFDLAGNLSPAGEYRATVYCALVHFLSSHLLGTENSALPKEVTAGGFLLCGEEQLIRDYLWEGEEMESKLYLVSRKLAEQPSEDGADEKNYFQTRPKNYLTKKFSPNMLRAVSCKELSETKVTSMHRETAQIHRTCPQICKMLIDNQFSQYVNSLHSSVSAKNARYTDSNLSSEDTSPKENLSSTMIRHTNEDLHESVNNLEGAGILSVLLSAMNSEALLAVNFSALSGLMGLTINLALRMNALYDSLLRTTSVHKQSGQRNPKREQNTHFSVLEHVIEKCHNTLAKFCESNPAHLESHMCLLTFLERQKMLTLDQDSGARLLSNSIEIETLYRNLKQSEPLKTVFFYSKTESSATLKKQAKKRCKTSQGDPHVKAETHQRAQTPKGRNITLAEYNRQANISSTETNPSNEETAQLCLEAISRRKVLNAIVLLREEKERTSEKPSGLSAEGGRSVALTKSLASEANLAKALLWLELDLRVCMRCIDEGVYTDEAQSFLDKVVSSILSLANLEDMHFLMSLFYAILRDTSSMEVSRGTERCIQAKSLGAILSARVGDSVGEKTVSQLAAFENERDWKVLAQLERQAQIAASFEGSSRSKTFLLHLSSLRLDIYERLCSRMVEVCSKELPSADEEREVSDISDDENYGAPSGAFFGLAAPKKEGRKLGVPDSWEENEELEFEVRRKQTVHLVDLLLKKYDLTISNLSEQIEVAKRLSGNEIHLSRDKRDVVSGVNKPIIAGTASNFLESDRHVSSLSTSLASLWTRYICFVHGLERDMSIGFMLQTYFNNGRNHHKRDVKRETIQADSSQNKDILNQILLSPHTLPTLPHKSQAKICSASLFKTAGSLAHKLISQACLTHPNPNEFRTKIHLLLNTHSP